MCVIIYKPAYGYVTSENLYSCWVQNPDGMGLLWHDGDGIKHKRYLRSFTRFERFALQLQEADPWCDLLIHFRWATHGTVSSANCHPFKVNKNLYMVHNGVIPGMPSHPTYSDTRLFADELGATLGDRYHLTDRRQEIIASYAGGSKLAFLDSEGTVTLIGEERGHWLSDGCWYSNLAWKPARTKTLTCDGWFSDWK